MLLVRTSRASRAHRARIFSKISSCFWPGGFSFALSVFSHSLIVCRSWPEACQHLLEASRRTEVRQLLARQRRLLALDRRVLATRIPSSNDSSAKLLDSTAGLPRYSHSAHLSGSVLSRPLRRSGRTSSSAAGTRAMSFKTCSVLAFFRALWQ